MKFVTDDDLVMEDSSLGVFREFRGGTERVQKRIVYWNKQNNDVLAPNYMLKVQREIIKNKGL